MPYSFNWRPVCGATDFNDLNLASFLWIPWPEPTLTFKFGVVSRFRRAYNDARQQQMYTWRELYVSFFIEIISWICIIRSRV